MGVLGPDLLTQSPPRKRRFGEDKRTGAIAAYSLLIAITGWALLLYRSSWSDIQPRWVPLVLFTVLSLSVKRLGFQVTRDVTHSLVGIADLAALFAFGPEIGAWVAALSGFAYLEFRALDKGLRSWRFMGEQPLFSSGLKIWMVTCCSAAYTGLGGVFAPRSLEWSMFTPLFAAFSLWFALDHLAWGLRALLRGGKAGLSDFYRRIASYSFAVELLPLPFSIVLALVYTSMGLPAFMLMALALLASGALLQRHNLMSIHREEHLADLEAVNAFSYALAEAPQSVQGLGELLCRHVDRLVDSQAICLDLAGSQGRVERVACVRHDVQEDQQPEVAGDMIRWMQERREAVLREDLQRKGPPFAHDLARERGAFLAVPLLDGPRVIGALSLYHTQPHAFARDTLNLLSAMAHVTASAISNARAYELAQRRARQLSAVSEVGRRVAAVLELDKLFSDVVSLVQENFHYPHVSIYTTDPATQRLEFRASSDTQLCSDDVCLDLGDSLVGLATQFSAPVLSNDLTGDTRRRPLPLFPGALSGLAVPLRVEGRIVGVLDVQSDQKGAFDDDDLFILRMLADQVAIAVQDARLYATMQEEAWVSTALLQVAEALGGANELDQVIEAAVRITPLVSGVSRCAIWLWHEEHAEFVPGHGYAADRRKRPLWALRSYRAGEFRLLDELRKTHTAIEVDEKSAVLWLPANWPRSTSPMHLLALPLRAQAEFHGVLLVDCDDTSASMAARRRMILTGIADQAAMASAGARAQQAQQEEAWVSTALLQVAQSITSSGDMRSNLERITRLLPLLVGVDSCMIFLWDPANSEYTPYEACGLTDGTLRQFHAMHLPPASFAAEASRTLEDARADGDLIAAHVRERLSLNYTLAVPLSSRGEALGVLCVGFATAIQQLSAHRLSLLEGVAHQASIAIENTRLYQGSIEQERMSRELDLAREIQLSFLPDHCPYLPGWDIAAAWHAARGVSGDFYDFITVADGRLGLVIADVSDKGIPAALFMSVCRTLVRASAIEEASPARALEKVNRLITSDTHSNMFITLVYGVLDPVTGRLTYCRAGHNLPFLLRAASGKVEMLTAGGMALGVLPEITLLEDAVTLEPGDLLLLYTDGVTEPINAENVEFGEERLEHLMSAGAQLPGRELLAQIHREIEAFTGGERRFDDQTLVAVKRLA